MTFGNIPQSSEVRRLPIEVNRHDHLRARRNGSFYLFRIEVVCARTDVYKNRSRARVRYGFGGRDEGVGGRDHFIARANADDLQSQS